MARTTTIPTNGERAIALVQQRQALLAPSELHIRHEVEVFGGILQTVTFNSGKEGRILDSFVFNDGKSDLFFSNPAELARYFDAKHSVTTTTTKSVLKELTTTGGAPALIAVMITITICSISISGDKIPDILGNALATILGFYFGSKVTDRVRSSS